MGRKVEFSGAWTRQFLKDVGKKSSFPKDRNSGMVYARAILNNAAVADNMFRMGLSDSADCNCSEFIFLYLIS